MINRRESIGRRCASTFFIMVMTVLLTSCSAAFHERVMVAGETIRMKVESTINGVRRSALVHIPQRFSRENPLPLVVVLHGAFSTAAQMEKETGLSTLADEEGFVVLYPEGMGILGFVQHWNAGHCCGKAADDDLDDVAFLQECIDTVKTAIAIDGKRIYVLGFSNGGMMAHRFAAEKSGEVAAMASLGAAAGGRKNSVSAIWQPVTPEKAVPVLLVHGTGDQAVPLEGGQSPARRGERQYYSLEQSGAFWRDANGCGPDSTQEWLVQGFARQRSWSSCRDGAMVRVITIEGWGHRWPGPYFSEHDERVSSFDVSRVIWDFFREASHVQ